MQCKYIHESHQFGKNQKKKTKNKNKTKLDFRWKIYFHVIKIKLISAVLWFVLCSLIHPAALSQCELFICYYSCTEKQLLFIIAKLSW